MLIEVNVQATKEQVHITLPQFYASIVVKNSVACRVGKNGVRSIVAVGEDADSLVSKTPAHFQGDLADLNFVHPFDVEQFQPELIEMMILYFVAVLKAKAGKTLRFWSIFIDRWALSLFIADYQRLPLSQRQVFEYELKKSHSLTIRELIVNGGSSLSPEFIQEKRRFERQCATADWVLWILRAVGTFGPFWLLARVWPSLPITSNPVWIFVWLVAELASVVLGDWLALTIWGIVMPGFLPISMLRTVVTKSSIAKIEKTWLARLLRMPHFVDTNS